MSADCRNCGHPRVYARRLCRTCYEYRRVHGRDRPEALVIRQAQREYEIEQLRVELRRAVLREDGAA